MTKKAQKALTCKANECEYYKVLVESSKNEIERIESCCPKGDNGSRDAESGIGGILIAEAPKCLD